MLLYSNYQLGTITLKNKAVMAPMTRNRAIKNIPNELMAKYYGQRSGAGLIITEGTAPSPNGLGYARIPGIFNDEQINGWRLIADQVHQKEGKIFMQIMHTGRVSHPDNMEEGTCIMAPSAVALSGEVHTDKNGMQSYPTPKEMTLSDIEEAQNEFVQASVNAIKAGIDGIELHSANGYLLDQFINPCTNKRSDKYGGSIENRCRFVIEVAQKVALAIGKDKTGIRFSPYGVFNDMTAFDDIEETYEFLAQEMNKIGIVYIHLVDHSAMGAPEVPVSVKEKIRAAFSGTIIHCGGYNSETAEKDLKNSNADLIAFGRPFISNPDLLERFKKSIPLQEGDFDSFYSPDEKGYTDYKTANEV